MAMEGRREGEGGRERESRKEKRRETLAGLWLSAIRRPVVGGGDCCRIEVFSLSGTRVATSGRKVRPMGTLGREATEYFPLFSLAICSSIGHNALSMFRELRGLMFLHPHSS